MAHDDHWSDAEEVPPAEGGRRGRGCIVGVFALLVIAALYAGSALYVGDRVPSGTQIEGVALGGLSEGEARDTLEDELAGDAAEPVTVEAGGQQVELDPQEAGLSYDYDESVEGLTGFSLNPANLLHHVTGGPERDIDVTVDEDELTAAVDRASGELDEEPIEGAVQLDGTRVEQTASEPGLTVDRESVVEDVADQWPDKHLYEAPTSEPKPQLRQSEIERFAGKELEPLVSGPITVESTDPTAKGGSEDFSFTVSEDELAEAVSVTEEKGSLSVSIDEEEVLQSVKAASEGSGHIQAARDASVTHQGGDDFEVAPAASGLRLKEKGLVDTVTAAMEKTGEKARTVTLESMESKPDFTTSEAERTLPEEQISTFTTQLTSDPVRTKNIKVAAEDLDGAYVPPGETFSLNARLGERTGEKGYGKAPVIENGRLTDDYGGGISQLSTTLFNAVFFSGARIEEFHPHSFYISRYPEGREATISWPNVDQRFTNDTGAGILIEASVEGNDVEVTFQGRKAYDDVRAEKSERRNVVQPDSKTDDSQDCVPQQPTPGFDVTVERIFVKDGRTVKTSDFDTHYVPEDKVTCTG